MARERPSALYLLGIEVWYDQLLPRAHTEEYAVMGTEQAISQTCTDWQEQESDSIKGQAFEVIQDSSFLTQFDEWHCSTNGTK